jgi:dGTPase
MEWSRLLCQDRIRSYQKKTESDLRSEFEKDYHRIIGSASFRRLQDKTQVFPLDQSDFVRTRLTHSLEVSSFAKSLGQNVSARLLTEQLDPSFLPQYAEYVSDILQCAGLIHDIGNPPFGHFGETAIREWFLKNLPKLEFKGKPIEQALTEQMKNDFYHFEGNTQAFRLVTKLHFLVDEHGMNLTKGLLATIIKYPVSSMEIEPYGEDIRNHKMGYYHAERTDFMDIQEAVGTNGRRHPLCFLLEAADDIAYRTADIEDGYKKGLILYADLLREVLESIDPCLAEEQELADLLGKKFQDGIRKRVTNPEEYAIRNWIIAVQGKAIQAATDGFILHYDEIMQGSYKKELLTDTAAGHMIDILGNVEIRHVFHSNMIYRREIAEEVIMEFLLDKFVDAALYYDTDVELKPVQTKLMALVSENYKAVYRIFSEGKPEEEKLYLRLLLITDYICGMTDGYAKNLYQELNAFH